MDMTGADFAGVHNFMFSQPYSNASFHTYLNLWFVILALYVVESIVRICAKSGDIDTGLFFSCIKFYSRKVYMQFQNDRLRYIKMYLKFIMDGIAMFLFMLNLILIIISNPSIMNPGPRSFSIFYNNVQGFVNTRDLASDSPPLNMTKVHEIHGYIYTNEPDAIILNETWLKTSIRNIEVIPDNYKVFRIDRSSKSHPWDPARPKKFRKNGGGVLIALRNDLNLSSVKFTKVKVQAELLSIILKTESGRKFTISTFYRVGTLGLENFKEFERHFRTLALDKKLQRHVLIGDFNFSDVTWPEGQTSCDVQHKFLDFLIGDLGHTQLINHPTHKSGNILDLVFTNIPSLIKNVRVLEHNESCLADHFGITLDLDLEVKLRKMPRRRTYNYRKANWAGLNFELRRVSWNLVIDNVDPHIAWPRFKNVLTGLCDRYIPKKTIKSQFQPPWYDSDVDKIRKNKEKWRKRARDTSDPSQREIYLEKFRSCRKQFKQTMNEKMRLNVEDDSDPGLISKKFWSHVKSRSKSTRIPETVRLGTRFRTSPADQSELFNSYFYEQFSDQSLYDIDINYSNDQFYDLKFHSFDVFLILNSLKVSKAPGPDGIHGEVLKNCASSLANPLSLLFNLSFSTGCIPSEWKLALVVPVFKKGDKGSVENYRPISLTSLVMKVFERCIKRELFSACSDLLDPRQHGFVNEKSCTTQMIPFTNDLALALNSRSRMDVIYFDFAKAFDSVSHDLILTKLKNMYKIDGLMLKFIKAYLEGRQQQTVVGGATSSSLPVQSGVPQGSILGPLLFVLFINDMFSCVSEGTNIALYADDTKIWREIFSYSDHQILQNDINNLFEWSVRNKMRFHPAKCKALSVTMQRNILDNLPFNVFLYELHHTTIDYIYSQTDLGVDINTRLNFNAHCNKLLSKASSNLGLLRRTCHFIADKRQKRSFYLAIVRSLFEHCSVVWSPQYATNIEKFSAFQKRAVKWIYGETFASYSNEMFLEKQRELKILPMKLKFIFNDIVMFYKVVNGLVPITLPPFISACTPSDVRYTRRNAPIHELSDLSTFQCSVTPNCDQFKHSFFYRTFRKWNSLPIAIRQTPCLSALKAALTTYMWSPDTEWPD